MKKSKKPVKKSRFAKKPTPTFQKHVDNDPRWNKDCTYCYLFLRFHYKYDHALKHQFCPNCMTGSSKPTPKKEEVQEECPIKKPKPRSGEGLFRLVATHSCPFPLTNAKWSTLKEWGEKCRDHFQNQYKFLTVAALCSLARSYLSTDRGNKAVNRLKELYSDEWAAETESVGSAVRHAAKRSETLPESRKTADQTANAEQQPDSPAEKTRQNANNHDSDRKVLAVIKNSNKPISIKEIKRQTKMRFVTPVLKRLLSTGRIVKTNLGNYKVKRNKKS